MVRTTEVTAGRSARALYAQAVAQRRRRRVGGWVAAFGLVVVAGVALAAWPGLAGQPWAQVTAVIAGAAVGISLISTWVSGRDPERWLRGADGETATAALLARLPERKWAVLHDRQIPGRRANLDHLVIGPKGVWLLDSKAYRGQLQAGWRSVRVGGRRIDTSTTAWEASVAAERLGVEVRPLVVVHGRGLPRRGRRCGGVRVIPAQSLDRWLHRPAGARLTRAEIRELADAARATFPPSSTPCHR